MRREDLLTTDTNGYRLVHGENDGLPGLIVDVYDRVAVIKIYTAAWWPWLEMIRASVQMATQATAIVLRLARRVEEQLSGVAGGEAVRDGALLFGGLPEEAITFREHGVEFYANPIRGHKTGFFLDHRANRLRVSQLARDKTVLDVFSYAGGFSVHALDGGARHVTSLDVSEPALEQARENVALNFGAEEGRHATIAGDAFTELARLRREGDRYDIVVVDPPSFAKRDKEVPGALAAYKKINSLAVPLVRPGGILVAASCSARVAAGDFFEAVERAVRGSRRRAGEIKRTFHDADHPIGFPEGAYLKTVYWKFE